jgi:hypothetical protein
MIPIVRARAILQEKHDLISKEIHKATAANELMRLAGTPAVFSYDQGNDPDDPERKAGYLTRQSLNVLPTPMQRIRKNDGTVGYEPNAEAYASLVEGNARLRFGSKARPSIEMRQAAEESIVYDDRLKKSKIQESVRLVDENRTRLHEIEIAFKALDALTEQREVSLEIPGNEPTFERIMAGCASAATRFIAPSDTPTWWPGANLFPFPTIIDDQGFAKNGLVLLSQRLQETPGPIMVMVDPEQNAIWYTEFTAVEGCGLMFGNVPVAANRGRISNWPAIFQRTPGGALLRQMHPETFEKQKGLAIAA